MATLPTTHTVAVGDFVTASDENTYVRDPQSFWLNRPRVHAYAAAAQTLTTGTVTLVPFDTEAYDSDGMHSTSSNTSRLVVNTGGLYWCSFGVTFATNATSWRYLNIRKNAAGAPAGGTSVYQGFVPGLAVSNNNITASFDLVLAAGDYLEVFASQNSGANLNTVGGLTATFGQLRWVAA